MGRLPEPAREAERADREGIRQFGVIKSVLAFFDPGGWFDQPYWPPGRHGKLWHLLHRTR